MRRGVSLCVLLAVLGACKQDSGSDGAAPAVRPADPPKGASTPAVGGNPAPSGNTPAVAGGGKHLGSCMIGGVACSDYAGPVNSGILESTCKSVGKWSTGACPTAGIQGTCTKTEPGGIVNRTHTYAPGTPETAKTACDNTPGGVFSAR